MDSVPRVGITVNFFGFPHTVMCSLTTVDDADRFLASMMVLTLGVYAMRHHVGNGLTGLILGVFMCLVTPAISIRNFCVAPFGK